MKSELRFWSEIVRLAFGISGQAPGDQGSMHNEGLGAH